MPSPREIALDVNKGFEPEPVDDQINPRPREPDYAVNPKNPSDGSPPVKNVK